MTHVRPTHRRCFFGEVKDLYWLNELLASPSRGAPWGIGDTCACSVRKSELSRTKKEFSIMAGLRKVISVHLSRPEGFGACRPGSKGLIVMDDREDSQMEVQACDVL